MRTKWAEMRTEMALLSIEMPRNEELNCYSMLIIIEYKNGQ